jgi:anti-sigma regulatory factor (Ser/Thr protein kinase)
MLHLELLAIPKAVPELRRAVRDFLQADCPDVQLCVSELLTNVITHVGEGTPVTLRVTGSALRTRIELTDPDPRALPVHLHAAADAESGRGMALLSAVALRWGIEQGPDHKTVWCELPAPGPPPPSA